MTFQVGNPGKPKGAVSKINSKFAETMNKHGFDIAQEMLDMFNEARVDQNHDLCVKILCEMAQYVYPKLKAMEVSNSTSNMSDQEKIEALRAMLKALEDKNG